jgi:hypothetical protein
MTTNRRRTGPQDIVFEECPGHADDDWVLTSGAGIGEELYCDGTCTGEHAETCECPECENERAAQDDYDASFDRHNDR